MLTLHLQSPSKNPTKVRSLFTNRYWCVQDLYWRSVLKIIRGLQCSQHHFPPNSQQHLQRLHRHFHRQRIPQANQLDPQQSNRPRLQANHRHTIQLFRHPINPQLSLLGTPLPHQVSDHPFLKHHPLQNLRSNLLGTQQTHQLPYHLFPNHRHISLVMSLQLVRVPRPRRQSVLQPRQAQPHNLLIIRQFR